MKSFAFTSFFTNKTPKDTNELSAWPSCKNQTSTVHSPSYCDAEHNVFDFSREVGLTKSDRLFFERGHSSKSIMEEAAAGAKLVAEKDDSTCSTAAIGSFKGGVGVAMAVESKDPYRDFRESMEQMVMAHGAVRDWEWLQEMLRWYLRANRKTTHGIILGAFLDLLTSLAKSTDHYSTHHFSNHISSCSSNCSCFSFEIN